jgi:hypothetical protein
MEYIIHKAIIILLFPAFTFVKFVCFNDSILFLSVTILVRVNL